MSVIGSNILAGASGGPGAVAYEIERSLRFNRPDTPSLSKTFSSAGNQSTWTWSAWVKRAEITTTQSLFSCYSGTDSNDGYVNILFNAQDKLSFSGWSGSYAITNAQFRDPSAWYHIVIAVDQTQSNTSDRIKIYVNGVAQTFSTYSASRSSYPINSAITHNIGSNVYYNSTTNKLQGYLADVHFIDGQALAATDFGAPDATTGVWNPIEYTGTYGTNGFRLDFSDNSTNAALGTDSSGNSNTWTVTNISATAPLNDGPFSASNAYTGTTSNSYGSSDGSWNSAFDGSTSNGVYVVNQSGESILTMVNSASWSSSIRIRSQYMSGQNDGWVKLNTTEISPAGSSSAWSDVTSTMGTSGTLTSVGVRNYARLFAIELDGEILTDSASAARVDSLIDTPTNYDAASGNNGGNYATWNALTGNTTLSNGNLDSTGKSGHNQCLSTIGMSSGKYYCEITVTDDTGYTGIGIATEPVDGSWLGNTSYGYLYYSSNGNKRTSGTNVSYGDSFTTGDTIGIAFDADGGNLYFYKNGAIQNSGTAAFTGLTSGPYFFAVDQYNTSNDIVGNFGQRPFAISSVPTGYKSLCTQNLDDPLIEDGSTAFDALKYPGDGQSSQAITGYSFSPDFLWIKERSSTSSHGLWNTVVGTSKFLSSDLPDDEFDTTTELSSIDSAGFTVGSSGMTNQSSQTYVAWAWDAGANSNKTFTVTVVSDNGNKYRFDGHGTSAVTLDLEEGSTYVFDASDSSVDNHPFVLGTAANSGEYSTGVTYTLDGVEKTYSQYTTVSDFNAATTRKLTITVPSGAPTLYYWCSVHSGMGGQINTNSTAGATVLSGSLNSSFYNQSQTWSDLVTGTLDTAYGNSSATAPFDGDTGSSYSDGIRPTSGNYLSMNFGTTFANATSVKIYGHASLDGSSYDGAEENLKINGTAIGETAWADNGGGSGQSSATFTLSSGLTSLEWGYSSGSESTGYLYLQGIEVDGKLLTDQGVTPSVSYPSINSTVRANPSAGFSIVSWSGSGGDATCGHGLNSAPVLLIIKNRSADQNWRVYTTAIDGTMDYGTLDETGDFGDSSLSVPTSSVFSLVDAAAINASSNNYIAYCFAPVEGYSAFGSYTGNGLTNGPFVFTGMRPRWVMVKCSSASGTSSNWVIHDTARNTYNVMDDILLANGANDELTDAEYRIDCLSNGFKIRNLNANWNSLSATYVYAAFAEHPFKTARAR